MTLSPRLEQPTGNRPDNHRMKTTQTASIRLHPPAHAGVSTGGVGSGFFAPMKTPDQYEAELESLRAMNAKLQLELTKALEAVAEAHRNQQRKEAA